MDPMGPFLKFDDLTPGQHVQRVINALDKIADSLDEVRSIMYSLQEFLQPDEPAEKDEAE